MRVRACVCVCVCLGGGGGGVGQPPVFGRIFYTFPSCSVLDRDQCNYNLLVKLLLKQSPLRNACWKLHLSFYSIDIGNIPKNNPDKS